MNREEIENLVVDATRRTDKRVLIRSAIDMALGQISTRRLWSDLMVEGEVTISASAASVELAADTARITEIRLMDGNQSKALVIKPKKWLTERYPDPASMSAARPYYGYLQGITLFVIPYPDVEYDINYTYFRLHPALSSSTSPVLIRGADLAVQAWATHWVFKSIEKHADAKEWLELYGQHLRAAEQLDKDNPVVQHLAVQHQDYRPVGEYWNDPFCERMP